MKPVNMYFFIAHKGLIIEDTKTDKEEGASRLDRFQCATGT